MAAEFIFEDKQVKDFISAIAKNMSHVQGVKKEYVGLLSALVIKDVDDHFAKEEGPKGKWQPWSDIYRKHMNRTGNGGRGLLKFSGRLRQNFKPTDYKKSSEGVMWFNNAKTKSGYPYAAGHDEGDGKLPQREFMYLSDKALDDIAGQTLMFVLDKGI